MVDVQVALDMPTRALTLTLSALDPLTGWFPEDPLVGLLAEDRSGHVHGHERACERNHNRGRVEDRLALAHGDPGF